MWEFCGCPETEKQHVFFFVFFFKSIFYDNSTNSRVLIGYFLWSTSRQTQEFRTVAMRQRARVENLTLVCYRKKKTNGRQFFMRLFGCRQ